MSAYFQQNFSQFHFFVYSLILDPYVQRLLNAHQDLPKNYSNMRALRALCHEVPLMTVAGGERARAGRQTTDERSDIHAHIVREHISEASKIFI
jgi:hypothetical protein